MQRKRLRLASALGACVTVAMLVGFVTPMGVGAKPAANVARTVTTDPVDHLHFEGAVDAPSNAACEKAVKVKIQRRTGGTWSLWGSGKTDNTGYYSISGGPDKKGYYRAVAPQTTKAGDTCLRAVSATQHYSG